MSSGQQDYIQKGIKSAEQATAEDKAQNYEAAAQHYMTAADWLTQAIEHETMDLEMKQTMRPKVESYVNRAEEIKEILKNGSPKKKAVADTADGPSENSKDEDESDPDKKQMIQKSEEAIVTDPNVSFADVIGLDRTKEALQKGIKSAEQAIAEDKAQNHKAAVQHYTTAAEWLMQAIKYGAMNSQMRQKIRSKVGNYLQRAEEITDISKNGSSKKKAVADTANGRSGNSKDDDEGDPDRKRMMQKFEEAIVTDPNVSFADVVGLDQAKTALKEAVILPVKFPQLFQGGRHPRTSILLYGPPGTGKSYLAKAVATECKSTFISVSSSDFHTRWSGENEKRVKCLFELARERRPCIIFIDEIDALCGQHNDTESESWRRLKTELLIQMQGVGTDNNGVLVFAATNIPWALDTAIRRRFEKRIYIPLPGVNERAAMFKTHLSTNGLHTIKEHEWMQLAQRSEHYSGADITVVCREAFFEPIRRLGSATHFKRVPNPKPDGPRELWLACSPVDPAAEPLTLDKVQSDELCEPPVTISDVIAALTTQKPTVDKQDLIMFQQYTQEFGQEGV